MRIRHQPGVEPLLEVLDEEAARLGTRALVVGGYVRDRILGRDCTDLDVVVQDNLGLELASAVARRLSDRDPVLFERFGTAQVTAGDFLVEFVSARNESYLPTSRRPTVRPGTLEEDVWRRDFTCNTLLATSDGEVIDATEMGLRDIEARLLRTPFPASTTFYEDPLRAVRAIRFAVTLGFEMHRDLMPAIVANRERLRTVVSVERVAAEVRKMILSPRPGEAIRLLHQAGVLGDLLPEVAAMDGVEQTGFHSWDVLEHTLRALDMAAGREQPALEPGLELALRLAVLFHDVGKPVTALRDGERVTFIGHPEAGADIAQQLMRRLRFSNDEVDRVASLVRLHMRPIQYLPEWSDGAVRRLVRDADDLLPAMVELARVDMAASSYPADEAALKLGDLRRRVSALDAEAVRDLRPALDGHALMERLGRPPGPWLGRIKQALLEAALDGEIPADASPIQAWAWLAEHPGVIDGENS